MEVILEHIAPEQLKPYIYLAFREDAELQRYHISPGSYRHMTVHNYDNIISYKDQYLIECYKVVKCDSGVKHDIGFTVVVKQPVPLLLSFGINVINRTKDVLLPWLEQIRELFGGVFAVGLWAKNERAINFFERNGFQFGDSEIVDNNKFLVLWQS